MSPVRKAVIAPLENHWLQYPASSAMPVSLFSLVDRDGLTKPLLQIIAEEAIDSGIDSIAVIASAEQERLVRDYFRRWPAETARELKGHDWAALQSEKLRSMGQRLTFFHLQERDDRESNSACDLLAAQPFVGRDPFLLLPASRVFLSDTKDRCAGQLLGTALPDDAVSVALVNPILQREALHSTVVQTSLFDPNRQLMQSHSIVRLPTLEQCSSLRSPTLPFGHFFAETGMAIYGSEFFDALAECCAAEPADRCLAMAKQSLLQQPHRSYCLPLSGSVYDVSLPYGLMETQLGLALAGIHRTDICEMITRTLAAQAKS